jgi:hypothetical protein
VRPVRSKAANGFRGTWSLMGSRWHARRADHPSARGGANRRSGFQPSRPCSQKSSISA